MSIMEEPMNPFVWQQLLQEFLHWKRTTIPRFNHWIMIAGTTYIERNYYYYSYHWLTHTIHPPCYSFKKLVIPCNNFRVCKHHRNTGMIVHGCYNMVVYLPTQFNPLVATSNPTRLLQSHWKEPSLLVHPSSHPLMFISHSLISVENT